MNTFDNFQKNKKQKFCEHAERSIAINYVV